MKITHEFEKECVSDYVTSTSKSYDSKEISIYFRLDREMQLFLNKTNYPERLSRSKFSSLNLVFGDYISPNDQIDTIDMTGDISRESRIIRQTWRECRFGKCLSRREDILINYYRRSRKK